MNLSLLLSEVVTAVALGVSAKVAFDLRFEAPYVLYSLALMGRLAGTSVGLVYPTADPVRALLPADDLGILLFYPLLIGAFRFASAAYRPAYEQYAKRKDKKKRIDWQHLDSLRMARIALWPLVVIDLLHVLRTLPWHSLPGTLALRMSDLPKPVPGLWGVLAMLSVGTFVTGLTVSAGRRV